MKVFLLLVFSFVSHLTAKAIDQKGTEILQFCDSVYAFAELQIPFLVENAHQEYIKNSKQLLCHRANIASRVLLFIYPLWSNWLLEKMGVIQARNKELIMPLAIDHHTGKMVLGSIYDWRSGFFPGLLWLMYEYSNNISFKNEATKYTQKLRAASMSSTHDLGFMINDSYGRAYDLIGGTENKEVIVAAAKTLSKRYNPIVKSIKSWPSTEVNKFPVIIDNMMNLELLFNATNLTGDSLYYKIALNHALTTMKNHFRKDNSCYHIVDYDPQTGFPIKKPLGNGLHEESIWSRGQSWALYGFTMCYRYTRDQRFLNKAREVCQFLLDQDYPTDLIPYWDMSSSDSLTPRDASSACIMASALIELSSYVSSKEQGELINYSYALLKSLHDNYQSEIGSNHGFLLLHSTSLFRGDVEVDVPQIYADYYYLEAVLRLRNYINHGNIWSN